MSEKESGNETKKAEEVATSLKAEEAKTIKGDKDDVFDEEVKLEDVPMTFNVIKAPTVCPPGYKLDKNGKCRKIIGK